MAREIGASNLIRLHSTRRADYVKARQLQPAHSKIQLAYQQFCDRTNPATAATAVPFSLATATVPRREVAPQALPAAAASRATAAVSYHMKTATLGLGHSTPAEKARAFRSIIHPSQPSASAALENYRDNRENGTRDDTPIRNFPGDGKYSWVSSLQVRYDEDPGDRAWMAEKDRNFKARMAEQGKR